MLNMIETTRNNVEKCIIKQLEAEVKAFKGNNNAVKRWYISLDKTDEQIAAVFAHRFAEGIIIKKKWTSSKDTFVTTKLASVAIKVGKDLTEDDEDIRLQAKIGLFAADIVVKLGMIDVENVLQDGKTVCYLAKTGHMEFNQLSRKVVLAYPDQYAYGDWEEPYNKGLPIVKKMYKDDAIHYAKEQIPMVYRALNALGNTEWHINNFVFKAAKTELQGFAPEWVSAVEAEAARKVLPPKMSQANRMVVWILEQELKSKPDLANNKSLLSHIKRKAAVTAQGKYKESTFEAVKTISNFSKWNRFEEMMEYVEHINGKPLKFCYNLDSRGRIYTIEHGINPQGSDIEKALLQFKCGVQATDQVIDNLRVHTANCAGEDKLSFEGRKQWTVDNMMDILDAYNAIQEGATTEWLDQFSSEKKTKWQLIAAIGIWGQLFDSENMHQEWIKVPIGLDATCSGLQILSVIGRDETCAEHVNIKQCDYAPVGDLYQYTAGFAFDVIANQDKVCKTLKSHPKLQDKSNKLWRKIMKRQNMTFPYACQAKSMGEAIFDDRDTHGDEIIKNLSYSEALQFGKVSFEQLELALPKATAIMKFLQKCTKEVETGTLAWTNSETGFRAYQRYEKSKQYRVRGMVGGEKRSLQLHVWYDEAKKADHKRSIAANFTHSQDSALLIVTINRLLDLGYTEFHMIHDQFGTTADGVEDVSLMVRGAFLDLYQDDDTLERFAAEVGSDELPPKRGSYHIYEIIDAAYCFC